MAVFVLLNTCYGCCRTEYGFVHVNRQRLFEPSDTSASTSLCKPSETKPSSYASGNATSLLVNRSQTFQEIEGFGGAFTDSASHVFDSMPAVLQEQLIKMYFGPTGLQYNMGRLTIGSCDFSLEYYNYDDTKGDTNLTHFNISHDEAKIIPFVQRAIEAANTSLHLVASPWSAPAWMKKMVI